MFEYISRCIYIIYNPISPDDGVPLPGETLEDVHRMYDLVRSRPAKLFGLNPTRDACRDAPLVGRLAAFVDVR